MYIVTLTGTVRNNQPSTYSLGRLTIVRGPSGAGKTRLLNLATLALCGEADDVRGRPAATRAAKDLRVLTGADELTAQAVYSDGTVRQYTAGTTEKQPLLLPVREVWERFYKDPEEVMLWYLPHMEASELTWQELLHAWAPLYASGDVRSLTMLGITQLQELEPGVPVDPFSSAWSIPKHMSPLQALLAATANCVELVRTTAAQLRGAEALVDRLRVESSGPEPTEGELQQMAAQVAGLEQRIQQHHAAQQQQAQAQERAAQLALRAQLEVNLGQWDDWLRRAEAAFGAPEQVRVREAVAVTQQAMSAFGSSRCATCGAEVHRQTMLEYAEQAKRALEPLHIARAQHRQATDDLRKRLAAIPPQTEPLPLHPELMILPLDQLQEAHKRDSNALAAMRATATGKAGLRAATASATRISTELAHHEAVLTVIRSIIWTRVHAGRDRFIARVNQYLPAGFRAHLNLGTAKKPDFSFSLEADGHQTTSLTGGRRTAVVYAIATAICAQDPQRRYRLLIPCADTGISGDLLGEMARALRAAPEWIQVILVSTEEPAGRVTDWTVLRLGEERKRRSRKTAPAGTPEEPPRLLDTTPAGHLETGEEFNQETADVQSPGTTLPSVPDALMDEAAILAFIRQDSSLAVLEKPMETPEVPEAKGTSEVDEDGASAQEADAEWDYVSDDDWSPIGDFDEEA